MFRLYSPASRNTQLQMFRKAQVLAVIHYTVNKLPHLKGSATEFEFWNGHCYTVEYSFVLGNYRIQRKYI